MRWLELTVRCPEPFEEIAVAALRGLGCSGTATELAPAISPHECVVRGWLPLDLAPADPCRCLQEHIAEGVPSDVLAATEIAARETEDVDWLAEWRKHHKPIRVGRRLLILPEGDADYSTGQRVALVIEPGMAFGTGSHPTTRLMLEYVDRLCRREHTVADVGTGSGILAIACAKLGAKTVYASESDALPRKIARENAARNSVDSVVQVWTPEEFEQCCPPCDLVLCNIIAETIIQLAPMLMRITRPGGHLVCSGIVADRLASVCTALREAGLEILETAAEEVWRAVLATPAH